MSASRINFFHTSVLRFMSYSDFTIEKVNQDFHLRVTATAFLGEVAAVQPSEWLVESLRRGADLARIMGTEKAKSELIIMPVLVEIHELFRDRISLFSGKTFNFDASLGLNGVCDYLITRSPGQVIIESPVVVMVEAKQGDLNSGWGQCIAEMVAAQKFNELSEATISAVYGVVTNGTLWQFLRLQGDRVAIEPQEYPLMPVANILGILRQMIGT
jgi:hypothetical protein